MRAIRIVVLVSTCILTLTGLSMMYMASIRGKYVPGVGIIDASRDPSTQPRHPVTAEMEAGVTKLDRKVGKFFRLPDTTGKQTLIGGQGPKPQFLYFVKKGCPCSFDAEPLLQSLYKHFGGRVDFISVTDASPADALKWVSDLKVPYPVVSDPKLETMEAYQAPASTYSTLLDKNGLIVKRWAGYSKEYLVEMNTEMAKALGEEVKPFDTQYAPLTRTSGCTFEGYKEQL